jgi:hypothetical protein
MNTEPNKQERAAAVGSSAWLGRWELFSIPGMARRWRSEVSHKRTKFVHVESFRVAARNYQWQYPAHLTLQEQPLLSPKKLNFASSRMSGAAAHVAEAHKLFRDVLNGCRDFLFSFWRIVAHNRDAPNLRNK